MVAFVCFYTGTLTTIEYQREALENANTNTEVLKIMGYAAKALKQTHNNMDIDKVGFAVSIRHLADDFALLCLCSNSVYLFPTWIIDLHQVEDLMDEVREQQQIAEEISSVISNPIGFGQDVDEDELMKELEDMEQEELDRQLLDTEQPAAAELPEVPQHELASPSTASSSSKFFLTFLNRSIKLTILRLPGVAQKSKADEDKDLEDLAAWAT